MLVSWMEPCPDFAKQQFDIIELYAGKARVSRIGRSAGYKCIASDVIYDNSVERKKSALNLCGNAGFAKLASTHHACIHALTQGIGIG